MPKIGLGLITYNRLDYVKELVPSLLQLTRAPFNLVVADDGSTDGTSAWLKDQNVSCIHGVNMGIPWGKNRLIHYFLTQTDCDPIFLMEDDCRVWEEGWEHDWIAAASMYGHMNWTGDPPTRNYISGSGTLLDPYWTRVANGHNITSSREALKEVGYFDTRFKRYGWEHIEWTERFGRLLKYLWGPPFGRVPGMCTHIGRLQERTYRDRRLLEYNAKVYQEIKDDPIYRPPYRNKVEQRQLEAELQTMFLRVE